MSERDWDFLVWRRVNDLLQQAKRIHQNFLQIAAGARYRASHDRTQSWEPPVNLVETGESLWVISALAGVAADRVNVSLEGHELVIAGERPLPRCCNDGELKMWEIPLGRFERRLRLVGGEGPPSVGAISAQNGLLIIELRKNS
jgi:HSP20 family protein